MSYSENQNPFFMGLIRGAEEEALRHDYSLILCSSSENPDVAHKSSKFKVQSSTRAR